MNLHPQRISLWLLALFLAAFAFWGARNPRLKFDSDPSAYLRFASALAKGSMYLSYPPDKVFDGRYPPNALFKGTYSTLMYKGHGVAYYSIGYPLFLALFILVGGSYAPFFANLFVFLALLVLLGCFTRRAFSGQAAAGTAALLAPALYWVFAREEISYLLAPYRDPLAYALLLGAMICVLAWLDGPRRARPPLVGGLLFGYAVAVRETAVLAALPAVLLALWSMRTGRWLPAGRVLAAIVLGTGIGAFPLLLQNFTNTGNPFYPTQMLEDQVRYGVVKEIDEDRPVQMKALGFANFPKTAPEVVTEILRDNNPLYIAFFAAGLWAGRASPATWLLLLPFILVHGLFFSCYIRMMWRYVFIAQLAAVPIVALGAAVVAERIGRLVRLPRLPEAVAAGTVLLVAGRLAVADEGRTFLVPQVEAFRRDLEARVPAGAVVFAERPLRDIIDQTTHAHGVRVEEIVRDDVGLSLPVALDYFERSSPGLFFLDSRDGAQKKRYDQTPLTREKLLSHYDLTPFAVFEAGRYGFADEFGGPRVTLYRVDPWRAKESVGSVAVGTGGRGVLRLDGRGVAPPGKEIEADVFLGEQRIGGSLTGGLNWFFADTAPSAAPVAVRVVSRAALPRDLAPSWYGSEKPIDLNVGPDAIPLDRGFLSREFFDPWERVGVRILVREGEASVPALPIPGSQLILAARVGPMPTVPAARAAFAGGGSSAEFSLAGPGVLRTVSLPLSGPDPGMTTAAVRVRPLPARDAAAASGPPALLLDRLTVSRLRFVAPPLQVSFGAAADPYIVEGMYAPETGPEQQPVRWTDGRARLRLPVAPAAVAKPWRLALRLVGPPAAAPRSPLRIALNGRVVGEVPVRPEVAQVVSCLLPRDLLHPGLNDLQLESASWSPEQLLGADDRRTLGIMLAELAITPAEEAP